MSNSCKKLSGGWIGVDFDATLAEYGGWNGGQLGAPIPAMLARVKSWLADGREVRIVTARVAETGLANQVGGVDDTTFAQAQRKAIQDWTELHIGVRLACTASKDFGMVELWDDRAVGVVPNTGARVGAEVGDLAMLVGRLVRELKTANVNSELQAKALDYLRRNNLQGDPLRSPAD